MQFYRIYRIYRICRRLFLVILISKTTKNSFLQILYRSCRMYSIPFGKTQLSRVRSTTRNYTTVLYFQNLQLRAFVFTFSYIKFDPLSTNKTGVQINCVHLLYSPWNSDFPLVVRRHRTESADRCNVLAAAGCYPAEAGRPRCLHILWTAQAPPVGTTPPFCLAGFRELMVTPWGTTELLTIVVCSFGFPMIKRFPPNKIIPLQYYKISLSRRTK